MKKILFLTTTPTVGGNGDALIEAAMSAAKAAGARVQRIDIREKHINPCKACYGCRADGVCTQKDDFAGVLAAIHECDGLVAEAPIYYNCMAAQAITVIDRFCCTFCCPTYQIGPRKKIGVLLTCTGSSPDEMKRHVRNIVELPSLQRSIEEEKTEVFTGCVASATCRNTEEYLERARVIGNWAAE